MKPGWPVVPICARQRRDCEEHVLFDGLGRICHVDSAGGGYDRFPMLAEQMLRWPEPGDAPDLTKHFILQLAGCPLRCPYCYVTPDGVDGEPTRMDTNCLMSLFGKSGCDVLHLMGGAPAIYYRWWPELLERLFGMMSWKCPVFHSDFTLVEGLYDRGVLWEIAAFPVPALYAVSVKSEKAEWYEQHQNPKHACFASFFWINLGRLIGSGLKFYITFTGMQSWQIDSFWQQFRDKFGHTLRDCYAETAYSIDVHLYKALEE